MADRYFVETPITSDRISLGGPEAHHLIHVMRVKCGSQITLFDGSGAEFNATVENLGRNALELNVLAREEIDRELPLKITLGVALPKGDRQKWLIEKAVELGVTEIVPLKTERAVAQPVEQALNRLERAVIEASKQCGRNRLMTIEKPQSWEDFVEYSDSESCRMLAHPQGFHRGYHSPECINPPKSLLLAIGPEGGFSPNEITMAISADWHTIDLGSRILRIETAALFLTTLALSWYARGKDNG
jgi:16S rRNA (uracil1498-N3)-methyltransferase